MANNIDITSPASLGTAKISKLLSHYAFPAIISMITASVYNIVDSIFIGHGVGPLAIAGLAITFPLMNLSAAFGTLVGVGGSSLMSIRLGEHDTESTHKILSNVVILNFITGLIFAIVCLTFIDKILMFFGASPDTIGFAREYMVIILIGNIITHEYYGLNAMLRSTGYPRKSMSLTLIALGINSVLDPLFIFVFKMGIAGAAIATVIAQVIGFGLEMSHFLNHKSYVYFTKESFHYNGTLAKKIIGIGMAPFLMNICSSIIVILINVSLRTHGGDLAIAAYGIVNRLGMIFILIVFGVTQGMQPIVGYNYGAKYYDRLKTILRLGMILSTLIMVFGFLIFLLFPRAMTMMFTVDETLIKETVRGLVVTNMMFPFVAPSIVISSFFQSIGKSGKAIILSLTRQLLFLIPLLLILPNMLASMGYGTMGVWLSIPISDFVAFLVSVVLLRKQMQQLRAEKAFV